MIQASGYELGRTVRIESGRIHREAEFAYRFGVTHGAGAVEVPASALVTDGEHQYVYFQTSPGTFARREVVAGSAHDGRVPILRGVQSGDTIVVEGAILLDNQISLND